jgi:arsenate reductase
MNKKKILFVCTGNSARSQVAEVFIRKYADDRFEAHSAGLEPKGLNPLTQKVMDEVGIDISGQTSKGVETYLGKTLFQFLITVCGDADKNCPAVWPGVNSRVHWSFQDPAAVEGSEEE